jgi:propanediol utilization protein
LALITALSHFLELETELELLGSGRNVHLTEGQLDALWTQTRQALESLALGIPPSVAHDSPDDIGEE